MSVVFDSPIPAPVKIGDVIAILQVETPETELIELPLLAGKSISRAGPFGRISGALSYMIFGPPVEE